MLSGELGRFSMTFYLEISTKPSCIRGPYRKSHPRSLPRMGHARRGPCTTFPSLWRGALAYALYGSGEVMPYAVILKTARFWDVFIRGWGVATGAATESGFQRAEPFVGNVTGVRYVGAVYQGASTLRGGRGRGVSTGAVDFAPRSRRERMGAIEQYKGPRAARRPYRPSTASPSLPRSFIWRPVTGDLTETVEQ